jgi:hypothetical protein
MLAVVCFFIVVRLITNSSKYEYSTKDKDLRRNKATDQWQRRKTISYRLGMLGKCSFKKWSTLSREKSFTIEKQIQNGISVESL